MCLQGLLGGKWVSALEAEANQPLVVLSKSIFAFYVFLKNVFIQFHSAQFFEA